MQRARRPALARAVSVRIAAKGGPNCDRPNRKWLIHIAGLLYATLIVPTDERICRELAHRDDQSAPGVSAGLWTPERGRGGRCVSAAAGVPDSAITRAASSQPAARTAQPLRVCVTCESLKPRSRLSGQRYALALRSVLAAASENSGLNRQQAAARVGADNSPGPLLRQYRVLFCIAATCLVHARQQTPL